MKPFGLLKVEMMLVGLAAGLILSPACRAQSEIDPDHFDGADSWEIRARKVVPRRPRQTLAAVPVSYQDLPSGHRVGFAAKTESSLGGDIG
jgi:hypothetical protein